jgi:hypothetical protein
MIGAPVFRYVLTPGWAGDSLARAAQAVPSLDLNFAVTKNVGPLVSFTRASTATYIDSAGTLQTAVTNLVLQSEDFATTWFLTSATLSSNAIAAPNGSLTAEQLIEAATTANHEVGQTFASPVANATYTLSCYLKAATSATAGIRFSNGLNGTGIICSVDLTAQTATVTAGTGTATIANVGSGWFRVSLTATASGAPSSTTVNIFRSIGTAGSIANSIYIWGAQLEQSSTVGEYIPTTSSINSAPRFDHNPTTGASLGLLVEEQRTNSIRNNTMVGAVAGTPGTSPTNWSLIGLSGLTQTIVGTGTESGIAYIDIRLFGTTSSPLFFGIRAESTTVVAATPNSIWTSAFYVRLVGGSLTNVTAVKLVLTNFNSSGVALNQFAVASLTPTSAALATQRYSLSTTSATFADATTAFVGNALQVEANSGAAIDFTLRIGLPQLELGAFATSVIPTSTAAATRNADVASITGANFSSWYRQDEGTVFASAGVQDFTQTNFPRLFSLDRADVSTNFIAAVRGSSTRRLDYSVFADATGQAVGLNNGIAPAANTTVNGAWVYKANDFIGAVNGVLTNSDTSGSVPTLLTTFGIGMQGNATLPYNGTIKRLTYWPQRLPNSTLQAITQ